MGMVLFIYDTNKPSKEKKNIKSMAEVAKVI
jgi:hypothetical protein